MAIKDVFAAGGVMPEPVDNEKSTEPPKKTAFMDDIEEAAKRGSMLRAFTQSAGFNPMQVSPTAPTTKEEEKTTVDLGSIFKSQSDLTTNLINKVVEAKEAAPKGGEMSLFLAHILQELKDTKDRMEEMRNKPPAPQVDPLDSILSTQSRMKQLTDSMREHLGITDLTNNRGGDLSIMIELEKIRGEAQERGRQWEESMFERKRSYEKEDRHWEADHLLRMQEYKDSKSNRNRAGDMVEDLIGSLSRGIEDARSAEEGEITFKATPTSRSKSSRPKFKCSCGNDVEMPPDGAASVKCERCGSEYDLTVKS